MANHFWITVSQLVKLFLNCSRYISNSKLAKNTLRSRWNARTLADAKAMIRLQTNLKLKILKKGDVVYKEGDEGNSMFIVDEERGGELSNL